MSEELKPCPFCGEVGILHVTEYHAMEEQNAALQDRIDALEWLREVEEVRRTMREWHPDKRKKNEDASKRRDNAWVGLCHICQNAREAVEGA